YNIQDVPSIGRNASRLDSTEAKDPGEQAAEGNRENGDGADEADTIDAFREKYVGACDGHATERILRLTGML
ncbi:MAG: hypothetical protein LUH20_06225, partial [Lachnospiraceae bacterium]|nr:hypothetical protein [Lachnospiraceae bacterium]